MLQSPPTTSSRQAGTWQFTARRQRWRSSTLRPATMKKTDITALRNVLRYISTADPTIQAEVLRLDAILAAQLTPKKEKPAHD